MSLFMRSLVRWLPLGVAVTLVLGVAYAVTQQIYRQGANDPQIMMARDIAASIAAGTPADQLVTNETVDPSKSLAPFVIVFDAEKKAVVSSAVLGGSSPIPPAGVLDAAAASGENRVTWQPRADARIASVIVPVKGGAGGYVLAGRSLLESEAHVDRLTTMAALGWLATMLATLATTMFSQWLGSREPRRVV